MLAREIVFCLNLQLILGNKEGHEIDHRYGNKLDNRKSKLRFATHQQNCMNNKTKGYWWNKINKNWRAQIMINGKKIKLGSFTDKLVAAKVAQEARLKYFGEFAYKETN